MTKLINSEEVVINEVKSIIEESKKKVVSYVNTTLLFMYWNIGKLSLSIKEIMKERSMEINLLKDYQLNLLRSMEVVLVLEIYV